MQDWGEQMVANLPNTALPIQLTLDQSHPCFFLFFFSGFLVFSGLSTGCQGIVAWKAKDLHKAVDLILLFV